VQHEVPTLDLGKLGYEAYRKHTGGISLASGQKIPPYDELNDQVRDAWIAAGSAIGLDLLREIKRTAAAIGGKATVRLAGDAFVLLEVNDPDPAQPVQAPVQKPSIGRIVIYHSCAATDQGISKDYAGIVVGVRITGECDIEIFGDFRRMVVPQVPQGPGQGQWSWPERV
jgi:hypothetical protein